MKTKDSGTDYFACDFRDILTGGASEDTPAESPAPEPQSIDLSAVGSSDRMISSLDDDFSDAAVQYEGARRPFRCMFVKDQKLKSGQRVTLSLLEDYVEGGVRIPANTHLAAICKIGDRLELQVRSLDALASTLQVKSQWKSLSLGGHAPESALHRPRIRFLSRPRRLCICASPPS